MLCTTAANRMWQSGPKLLSQLIAVDIELARADDADQRLAAFRPRVGDDVLCPYCWMYDKVERPLKEIVRSPDDEETGGGGGFRTLRGLRQSLHQ